jgi:hypothetical protein
LLPRCHEAARRTQRRRLVRLASAQRPLGGWQSRAAGWSRGVECCPGRCGNVVRDSTACLQCGIKRKQHRAQRCRRARLASTQRPLWWLAGLRAAGRSRGVECCIGRCGNVVSVPTPCLQRAFNHDRRTARRVFNFERAIVSQQGGPCVVSAQRAPTSGRVSQAWSLSPSKSEE